MRETRDIKISYGNVGSDLLLMIHHTDKRPIQPDEPFRLEHQGTMIFRDTTLDVVSELLQDFLLNTKRHFSHGYLGLRGRFRKQTGRDIHPYAFHFPDSGEGIIYPGLTLLHHGDETNPQISYNLSEQKSTPIGLYLPFEFPHKAKELVVDA